MKFREMISRHKKLTLGLLAALTGLCVWGMSMMRVQENLHAMIPASIREKVELFEHSPLNKKLFTVITAPTAEEALEGAETVRNYLLKHHLVRTPFLAGPEFAKTLFYALPARFSAEDEKNLPSRLTPEYISRQMEENYQKLLSFEGFLYRPLITADPLNFTGLMAQKLAAFGAETGIDYREGFLSAEDGKILIGLYDYNEAGGFTQAEEFSRKFMQLAGTLSQQVRAFYLGGLRYTVENVSIIRKDLIKITVLVLLALGGVFFFFLRRKTSLLIYLLPVVVLPPAALVTYAVFGHISGITLGFGSVVAGLSVDYSIYTFFAISQTDTSAEDAVQKLKKHLWCNFLTSSLCFLALFCSSVELFKQIAVFSVAGILLAILLALYVFPPFWAEKDLSWAPKTFFSLPVLSKKVAGGVSLFIVLFGIWGVFNTHFSSDLESLNSTSAVFKEEKALFDKVFSQVSAQNALLFVKGTTPEQALENNEKISSLLSASLATARMIPSAKAQRENLARWQQFWTEQQITSLRGLVEKEAAQKGFAPQVFSAFFNQLQNPQKDTLDFTEIYNPLIETEKGEFAVVNIVPNTPQYRELDEKENAVFVSGEDLKENLLSSIKKQAVQIVLLAILFNLLAVGLLFKNTKEVLGSFVPVVLAGCFTFGCFALFKVEVNLFVLVFLPLLMGLGIDYGIFQVMKFGSNHQHLYPPVALLTAALSTLAGFGVLACAEHSVLKIMGLSSFLGISGAMLASLFVLPALLEKKK
ncbi:MAG: hypothetical protein IJP25_05380 [Elusimicrobiaceae bacterium]|nr:hypothetical protein [Elusimicrobiaceae bacterium]